MAVVKTLNPLPEPSEEYGVLCTSVAPVVRSTGSVNHLCPSCGAALLEKVYEGQLFDLAFQCPLCMSDSRCEERPPGRPLAGRPVSFSAGRYDLGETLDLTAPVMVVGPQAIDGYVRETGARWRTSAGGSDRARHELGPAGLDELAKELVELLGDRYQHLWSSHRRGLASSTPPRTKHRLLELIDEARKTAVALQDPAIRQVDIDGNLVSELLATVSMVRRWRHHPAWPALVASLTNPTEVQHTVMTLLVASFLVDSGNGVGIVTNGLRGRIPDLWAQPTVIERLDVEVKTPLALRGPRPSPLDREEAVQLVERLLNDAASSSRGQLDPSCSGVLAIGGYHLGEGGVEALEGAVTEVLGRQRHRKPHVVGVIVCQASYRYSKSKAGISMMPTLHQRLVRHPGYMGDLDVRDDVKAKPGELTRTHAQPNPTDASRPNRVERRRLERDARRTRNS